MSNSERVLCVPSSQVHKITKKRRESFLMTFRPLIQLLSSPDLCFLPRSECENNPEYKQISLYSVFRCNCRVFAYRRGVSGGDTRLFGNWSIGIGGHASEAGLEGRSFLPSDPMERLSLLESEAMREINEEIRLDAIPTSVIQAGLVNHEDGDIGDYHIGVVYIWRLSAPRIMVREDCLVDPGWINVTNGELAKFEKENKWEGWSRIVIDNLGRYVS